MIGGRWISAAALGLCAALSAPIRANPVTTSAQEDRERAVGCLAAAVAYEAGLESVEGQQAVAEVVLNRVLDPAYPKTVCGVVFAGSQRRTGCQFTFTCDGALRRSMPERIAANARAVARAALDGLNPVRTAGATHYHAHYVSPYWAPSLVRVGKIGAHIFYRRPGAQDRSAIPVRIIPSGEPTVAMAGSVGREPIRRPATEAAPAPFAPWGLPVAAR